MALARAICWPTIVPEVNETWDPEYPFRPPHCRGFERNRKHFKNCLTSFICRHPASWWQPAICWTNRKGFNCGGLAVQIKQNVIQDKLWIIRGKMGGLGNFFSSKYSSITPPFQALPGEVVWFSFLSFRVKHQKPSIYRTTECLQVNLNQDGHICSEWDWWFIYDLWCTNYDDSDYSDDE